MKNYGKSGSVIIPIFSVCAMCMAILLAVLKTIGMNSLVSNQRTVYQRNVCVTRGLLNYGVHTYAINAVAVEQLIKKGEQRVHISCRDMTFLGLSDTEVHGEIAIDLSSEDPEITAQLLRQTQLLCELQCTVHLRNDGVEVKNYKIV